MNGSELRIQVVTSSMHLYFGWELWNMEHAAEFSRRDEEGPFPSRAVDGQKYGEQRPGTTEKASAGSKAGVVLETGSRLAGLTRCPLRHGMR
jgi:hypothetical protein